MYSSVPAPYGLSHIASFDERIGVLTFQRTGSADEAFTTAIDSPLRQESMPV